MRLAIVLALAGATAWWGGPAENLPERYVPLTKSGKVALKRAWGSPEQHVFLSTRVAFAGNGKTALVASVLNNEEEADDSLNLVDVATGSERSSWTLTKLVATALLVSADGKTAVVATLAGKADKTTVTLQHRDLSTGKILKEIACNTKAIIGLAQGPDGLVLGATSNGPVVCWDLKAGKAVHTFEFDQLGCLSVAFAPSGATGLCGDSSGKVTLLDLKTGKKLRTFDTKMIVAQQVAFLPDSAHFLVMGQEQKVALWSIADGKEVRVFEDKAASNGVTAFELSGDGKTLYVQTTPYNQARNLVETFVSRYEVATGKQLWSTRVDLAIPTPTLIAADGQSLLVGGGESCLTRLNAQTGKIERVYGGHRGAVNLVVVEPRGENFWTASQDGTVKRWASKSRAESFTFKPHDSLVTGLAITGDRLATASMDGTVKIWKLGTDELVQTLKGHDGGITSLALSADGKRALTGGVDRSLKVWDVATGKAIASLTGHSHSLTAVALSPDGKWAASGSEDKTVRLWPIAAELKDADPILLEGHAKDVTAVVFLPDGKHVLSASQDQTMILWNRDDAKPVRTIKGHKNWITCLALAPDGKHAATTCDDLTVRVWNLGTGEAIATLDLGVAGDVAKCVVWQPDGRGFLTGTANWLVLDWQVSPSSK